MSISLQAAALPGDAADTSGGQAAITPVALMCLLVFQNLFNAFSPYVTLGVNACAALYLVIQHRLRHRIPDLAVALAGFALLGWLLLVASYRGEPELQILMKYIRVTLAICLFSAIFGAGLVSASAVIKGINLALAFHVVLVLLQIAIPDLTHITAPIFGFARDITILEEYTLRKLGATSSYDTASLLSIAALLFFYLQYAGRRGQVYLLLAAIAFVATLMSSRTGMVLSLLIVTSIGLRALRRANLPWKLLASVGIAALLVFAYIVLYPLVLHSLGIAELPADEIGLVFAAADYGTTGTLEALTADHLSPLNHPLSELLVGYALDPNSIGRHSDIGYVKLIYHVGIVGTVAIVLLHLYMLARVRSFEQQTTRAADYVLVGRFFLLLLIITLAFNYKSLELYSRGIGDFIFFLYIYLASWGGQSRPAAQRGWQ